MTARTRSDERAPHAAPTQLGGPEVASTCHVIVMGVSGSGKTTVARGIARATGFVFAEADDFHSPANIEKMASGSALDDADRWPWLHDLAVWMSDQAAQGRSTVLACSALKRAYRDLLGRGLPCVLFVHLRGAPELLESRISGRTDHYMPVSLLGSQLETLEPLGPEEAGIGVDVVEPIDRVVATAVRAVKTRLSAQR